MKVFELSYSNWEDSTGQQFTHADENKTIEDFMADVNDAFKTYSQEYIDSEESRVSEESWVCFIAEKLNILGYVPIETQSYQLYGYCDSLDHLISSSLGQAAGKDICEKVIQKNNDFMNMEI